MLADWVLKGINGVRRVDDPTNAFTSGATAHIMPGEQIKVPLLEEDFIWGLATTGDDFDGPFSRLSRPED
jgi:hypothetical protein